MAERAGLDVDDVYSVITIYYPGANRILYFCNIHTYLFFDKNDKFIKHGSYEEIVSF